MYNKTPPQIQQFVTEINYQDAIEVTAVGNRRIYLLIEGMHCGSCVWLIENALRQQPNVLNARVNMSTRRLVLEWQGGLEEIDGLVDVIHKLGYKLIPYRVSDVQASDTHNQRELLWGIVIAGFATAQVMMLALAIWSGNIYGTIGPGTRQFLHWVIAIVAIPATLYSGKIFFRAAYLAMRARRSNMDIPISIGIIATLMVSIQETLRHSEYTYYDSALMLIFVLLISRYLDLKVRNQARSQAHELLLQQPHTASLLEDGILKLVDITRLKVGDEVLVSMGEKIPVDGEVIEGNSEVDNSIITGETIPSSIGAGSQVYAGTLNISAPIRVRVSKKSGQSLIAEIITLIENAEQSKARFVKIADKVARWYTPAVLILAIFTLVLWRYWWQSSLENAVLYSVSVLLITCPCAMALAVPAVQIVASTRLLKAGILIKSSDALERLGQINIVACDKTGTLTIGQPQLINRSSINEEDWKLIVAMAAKSKHPLCRAVVQAHEGTIMPMTVQEYKGEGMQATYHGQELRLGSAAFCKAQSYHNDLYQEIWFTSPQQGLVRLQFQDMLRPDAIQVIETLKQMGYSLCILSGDRMSVVAAMAEQLGIDEYYGQLQPQDKYHYVEQKQAAGQKVLMLGDGLNDVAVLKLAHASISPSSGIDLSQNSADIVFHGIQLSAVTEALRVARQAENLVWQNFALSFGYNIIAIPIAVLGLITPVFAAVAMSLSSLCVVLNALRLR